MTEWIAPALVIAAPMLTLLGALCYRAGLRDGRGEEAATKAPPAARGSLAAAAQREEERRLERILANIDAYDGTDAHQIDP